jgi:hypothetical protein
LRTLYIPENVSQLEDFRVGPFTNVTLMKAEEEGSKWVVYLEASNENEDREREVTVMKALKKASDFYLTHGVISWDHQHKPDVRRNYPGDPQCIIGEPTDVAFSSSRSTLVKGILYKKNQKAQGVMENMMSRTTRFGASVSGYVLKKSVSENANYITEVFWDDTAVTYKPVNDTTMGHATLTPFAEFAKALMAGAGINAAEFTGGRALVPESLRGKPVDILFKDFVKKVKVGRLNTYRDTREWVKSRGLEDDAVDYLMGFIFEKLTKKL